MSLLIDIVKNAKGKSIEKANIELKSKRLDVCKKCEHMLITGNCGICGCFVKDKVKYKDEKCPIKKW